MPREYAYNIDDLFSGETNLNVGGVNFLSGSTPSSQNSFYEGVGAGVLADGDLVSNIQQRAGTIFNGKASFSDTAAGYMLGVDTDGALKFVIGDAVSSMDWNVTTADTLTIAGTLSATAGTIGGFTIGATTLTATNFTLDSSGQRLTLGSANNVVILDADDATYRLWTGHATAASAPFRVTTGGALTATSATITGAITINSGSGIANLSDAGDLAVLDAITTSQVTSKSLLEKSFSMVFSVTDLNTIAWSSGTIALSDGTTYSISSGNTGNMAALTYVYLDPAVSTTVLQTTTTYSTAVGANKVLVGTAQNNAVTASWIPYGPGQPLIDGANIGALSIVAGNIAASTITAGKMSVSTLSAITADLGTITAGTVTGATIRTASSGTRFNMTSSTFQGINASGTVVFEIVLSGNVGDVIFGDDATGNYAIWDNSASTFSVFADNVPTTTKGTFGGDGSDGALTLTSGTTTISAASATTLFKNYTAISITSTGELDFSNPNSAGTIVVIKSQGNVTLTSSGPSIDLRGMGAGGGAIGSNGNGPTGLLFSADSMEGKGATSSTGATGGSIYSNLGFYVRTEADLYRRAIFIMCGAGGGGGRSGSDANGGTGGRGGGALYLECGGALNFTGTINASGATGGNGGTGGGSNRGAGGGGGGAAGQVLVLYNTLTSAAGTITTTGGNGGTGGAGGGSSGTSAGGGSGAAYMNTQGGGGGNAEGGGSGASGGDGTGAGGGGGGGNSTGATTAGGSGGTTASGLVVVNNYFA